MQHKLSLGSSPWGEECAQTVHEGYELRATAECRIYREQLIRVYQAAHNADLPKGCRVSVNPNEHDFGTYYDVVAKFDIDNDEEAIKAAFWLEANTPEEWDADANARLRYEGLIQE